MEIKLCDNSVKITGLFVTGYTATKNGDQVSSEQYGSIIIPIDDLLTAIFPAITDIKNFAHDMCDFVIKG